MDLSALGRFYGGIKDGGVLHPFYPKTLLLPGYAEPQQPLEVILGVFFVPVTALVVAASLVAGRQKQLAPADKFLLTWFAVSGAIHLLVEGAFVTHPEFYKDSSGNILLDMWKEYSKADSRYASRDSFVVSMEAVTVFLEGPGCFLAVYGLLQRKPWVYTVQLLVSVGQLYGDVLYFATTWLEGLIHSRPEPLYFWFYFVFLNSIWVVIPMYAAVRAVIIINAALAKASPVKED